MGIWPSLIATCVISYIFQSYAEVELGLLNYIHEFHIQHGNFEMGVCKNSCGAKYVATLQFNKY